MKQNLLKLPFDQYGRYKIIADFINYNKGGNNNIKILDIGGGKKNLLKKFLPKENITVVDAFKFKANNYIQSNALKMPFPDNKFNFVISCDVYEHIKNKDRIRFIEEQVRISNNFIILAAPFLSSEVKKAEDVVNNFHKALTDADHIWLKEHIKHGLPKESDLENFLKKRQLLFKKISNNFLLYWINLIKINLLSYLFPQNKIKVSEINEYYNKNIAPDDFSEPSYRKIYFISKNKKNFKIPDYKYKPFQIDKKLFQMIMSLLDEKIVNYSITKTKKQIRDIINSKSWRITRPLRWIDRRIKNINNNKKSNKGSK